MWKTSCSVELQLIPSTADVWSVTPVGASNDPDAEAGVVVDVDPLDPGAGPLVGGEVEGLEEHPANPMAPASSSPAHTRTATGPLTAPQEPGSPHRRRDTDAAPRAAPPSRPAAGPPPPTPPRSAAR